MGAGVEKYHRTTAGAGKKVVEIPQDQKQHVQ